MRVETVRNEGINTLVVGLVGVQSERFRSVTLHEDDLDKLAIQEVTSKFDGDGRQLNLGIQKLIRWV